MYCEQCGATMEPGNTFCTSCGTPVKPTEGGSNAVPPAPRQIQPDVAPKPESAKSKKKWAIIAASGIGLAVIIAVVLILVLVVFKGGGPEATVKEMYKYMTENNIERIISIMEPSAFEGDSGLKSDFKDYVEENLPEKGTVIEGLKFKTNIKGNKATVKIIAGTAKTKTDGKTETYDFTESGETLEHYLVEKDGKWYFTKSNFMDFFAKGDLAEADKSVDKALVSFQDLGTEIESAYGDSGSENLSPDELAQEFEEKTSKIIKSADELTGEFNKIKKTYNEIADAEGVSEDYVEYAGLRIDEIDTLNTMIDDLVQFLGKIQSFIDGVPATADQQTISQGMEGIVNDYTAQEEPVLEELGAIEVEIETLKEDLDL